MANRTAVNVRTRVSLALAGLCLLALGACRGLPDEGVRLLRDGNAQYQTGQYEEAERSMTKFIGRYSSSPASAEAYYVRGMARLALGQRGEAGEDFHAALKASKRRELTARAQAGLGNMAFDDGDYESAAKWLGKSLPVLSAEPPADEITYRLGVSYQRVGGWSQARKLFARIVEDYPDRPIEALARRQAAWNREYFAIQCGAFRQGANADKQAELLRRQGINAESIPDTWEDQPLFVVQVGRFDTYQQALKELPRVQQVVGDAIIRP